MGLLIMNGGGLRECESRTVVSFKACAIRLEKLKMTCRLARRKGLTCLSARISVRPTVVAKLAPFPLDGFLRNLGWGGGGILRKYVNKFHKWLRADKISGNLRENVITFISLTAIGNIF